MEFHLRTRNNRTVIIDRLLDFWLDHRIESKYISMWKAFIAVRNKEKIIDSLNKIIEQKNEQLAQEAIKLEKVTNEKDAVTVKVHDQKIGIFGTKK
jgi:hypothetical protein